MDNLHEDHEIMAGGKIDLSNENVLDAMNSALADVTASPSLTAYIAWGRVAKVLATYHVPLPKTFLEGNRGHEVIPINQFGNRMGMTDDGKVVVNNESNLFLYFEWQQNDMGDFDIFAEVVTSVDLPELLKSYEEDVSDLDEGYDPKEVKMGSKDEKEEHGFSDKMAKKTAKDHLRKVDKHYYTKLKSVGLEEMKDELNEISKKLMVNYMTKADKEVKGIEKTMKKTGDFTPEQDKQLTKRVKGMNIARDKFYKRGKVAATGKDKAYDQAQTILIAKNKKKDVSEDYEPKAARDAKGLRKLARDYKWLSPRLSKNMLDLSNKKEKKAVTGMDEENINELSKDTLRKYSKKAANDLGAAMLHRVQTLGNYRMPANAVTGTKLDHAIADDKTITNRRKGLNRASDRLSGKIMVKKKYLAKEEKAPFDNPTETPSTPYKNPHSKAKQLARAAMRRAMTSDKAFAKLSKKDQTEVNRRLRMSEEKTQDSLAGGLRRTDRPDLDLSKEPLNKKGKLSGNTKKWMKAFASPSRSLYSRKISGPKGHLPEENINEVSKNYLKKALKSALNSRKDLKKKIAKKSSDDSWNHSVDRMSGAYDDSEQLAAQNTWREEKESLNELHGKGKLEKMTKEYERKADAAKKSTRNFMDGKYGKTMKFSNEVEKWNTNMAKARRGYHLISKRDKETVDEATLGGEKYKGKENPNNGKRNKTMKSVQSHLDRHIDKQADAFDKWSTSKEGSKKQAQAAREHDREFAARNAGVKVLNAMRKKKKLTEAKKLRLTKAELESERESKEANMSKAEQMGRELRRARQMGYKNPFHVKESEINEVSKEMKKKYVKHADEKINVFRDPRPASTDSLFMKGNIKKWLKRRDNVEKVKKEINEVSKELLQKAGSKAFDLAHKYRMKGNDKRADKKIGQVDKIRSYMKSKGMKISTPKIPEPDELQKRYNELEYKGD